MFEYLQAAKLLCASQDQTWTREGFLKNSLRPEIQRLASRSQIREKEMLGFYLFLNAHVLAQSMSCESDDENRLLLSEFLHTVNGILQSINSRGVAVEALAAIESLLVLSSIDSIECVKAIQSWLANSRGFKLPRSLEIKISAIYDVFKHSLPADVKLNV
jgi:hypothetical protein